MRTLDFRWILDLFWIFLGGAEGLPPFQAAQAFQKVDDELGAWLSPQKCTYKE